MILEEVGNGCLIAAAALFVFVLLTLYINNKKHHLGWIATTYITLLFITSNWITVQIYKLTLSPLVPPIAIAIEMFILILESKIINHITSTEKDTKEIDSGLMIDYFTMKACLPQITFFLITLVSIYQMNTPDYLQSVYNAIQDMELNISPYMYIRNVVIPTYDYSGMYLMAMTCIPVLIVLVMKSMINKNNKEKNIKIVCIRLMFIIFVLLENTLFLYQMISINTVVLFVAMLLIIFVWMWFVFEKGDKPHVVRL